jgi:hypothetical protein
MVRTFWLMKSLDLHAGLVFGEVKRRLALLLVSDKEAGLTPSEIEHRLKLLLECGF